MKSRVLKVNQTLELVPTAPFNFDATLHKPDHFPAADTRWEPGTRWQTMLWQGKPLGLRFENHGTVARPRIALSIWSARQLGPVLRKWRGMRPLNYSSLYEYALGTTASSSPSSCKTPDGTPEPPDVAAIRETREEAGVIARVEGLLGIQNHATGDGEPRLYLLFLCRHVSGELTPDNHETDRAAYFSLSEMEQFDEPFDEFCELVARRVLEGQYHLIPVQPSNPYRPHLAYL